MGNWGRKITDTLHLDHVDLCEEAQTLSDGSKVRNVLLRTVSGGVVRFCMTDEKAMIDFAYELERLLVLNAGKMVAVEIDGDRIPEPRRDDCPRLSGQEIAIAEARDRDEEDRRKAEEIRTRQRFALIVADMCDDGRDEV